MLLLISAVNFGLVFALLALGVYISFRIFHFPDITADGSFALGAAVTAALLVQGWTPGLATLAGFLAGMLAGATTGVLHAKFNIHGLLSGILVTTALYSVNLRVLGRSNVSLSESPTLSRTWTQMAKWVLGESDRHQILGWTVGTQDLANLAFMAVLVSVLCLVLFTFLQTNIGTAMRGAGDNAQMIRALGASDKRLLIFGLALANGLTALSGSFLAQYQEFADVQMGIGMVVWGLASVIIGESLVGSSRFGLLIAATVIGSVLFRMMIAIALRCGLDPNDLKLITAVFVFLALVFPRWIQSWKSRPKTTKGGVAVHAQGG
jgi:putative tryptophan/tyrosine transport system permease protein